MPEALCCKACLTLSISSSISYELLLNDPKNLVVAYWWAEENSTEQLKEKLLGSDQQIVQRVQPTLDELIYGSFILLEEASKMTRRQRKLVRSAVERALLSIEEHTNESLSPLGTHHFGRDAT